MARLDRITVDARVCLGQPAIRGTRITVILTMLAAGKTIDGVVAAYPELTEEDVQQAIPYGAQAVSGQLAPTHSAWVGLMCSASLQPAEPSRSRAVRARRS